MKGPLFYAKILLFGEYGIIKDSKGLAIPYSHYQGALKIADETNASQKKSNKNLFKFHAYPRYLGDGFASVQPRLFC